MRSIIHTPNPILTTPSKVVPHITDEVVHHIKDMEEALIRADNPKGVGLAAPQVGIGLRIFLLRPEEKDQIKIYINPRYLEKSKEMVEGIGKGRLEGCLSVPSIWGAVQRHKEVKLSFVDESGNRKQTSFKGFAAIIVQHEMDHLEGVLFTRRVIEQKRTLYKPALDENGKEVLEPLEI